MALRLAVEQGRALILVQSLPTSAMLLAHAGELVRAVELLALALAHPGLPADVRSVAEHFHSELQAQLSPDVFAAA